MQRTAMRAPRRVQGLSPEPNQSVSVPTVSDLPTELRISVLRNLEKRDLKALRLASKQWCPLATVSLFEKLHVSPRKKDLEIFEKIAKHPVLSTLAKELVYDTSYFVDGLSYLQYFGRLCKELSIVAAQWHRMNRTFDSPNVQLNGLIEELKPRMRRPLTYMYEEHRHDEFIVEGFRLWQELSRYEQLACESGQFYHDLCSGLRQLDGLRSVVLDKTLWLVNLKEKETLSSTTLLADFSGSPLTRSWNPLHPRAEYWDEIQDQRLNRCEHLFTITRALSATHREILSFKVDDSLPAPAMAMSIVTGTLWNAALNVYSRLEALDITITGPFDDESDSEETTVAPISMLPALLRHMPSLTILITRTQLRATPAIRSFPTMLLGPN